MEQGLFNSHLGCSHPHCGVRINPDGGGNKLVGGGGDVRINLRGVRRPGPQQRILRLLHISGAFKRRDPLLAAARCAVIQYPLKLAGPKMPGSASMMAPFESRI